MDNGAGDQFIVEATDAEPAVVQDAMATVPPQGACCTEAKICGAGVIVTVILRIIGWHDPGGFIVKV